MADATPVNSEEVVTEPAPVVAPAKTTKKAASAAISEDVLAELKAQIKEELMAEQAPFVAKADAAVVDTFKVSGGVKLESHDAVREDY